MGKLNVFAYDIEATTQVDYDEEHLVRGYVHYFTRIPVDLSMMNTLHVSMAEDDEPDDFIFLNTEDAINWMSSIGSSIHLDFNLSYDGNFIMSTALNMGMYSPTYQEEFTRKAGMKEAKSQYLKDNGLTAYHINADGHKVPTYIPSSVTAPYAKRKGIVEVLKGGNKFIQITLTFAKGKAVLMDAGNKWTTAKNLEELAKIIGSPGKTSLDVYTRRSSYAPVSWEEYVRVKRDAEIVRDAMKFMFEEGMTHATLAGDAFSEWRKSFIADHEDEWRDQLYNPKYALLDDKKKHDAVVKDWFKSKFPERKDWVFEYQGKKYDLREAYRGGICYANPRMTRDVHDTIHDVGGIDCNSEHPTSMYYYNYPIGMPRVTEDMPLKGNYLSLVAFTALSFKLKAGHDPCWKTNNTMLNIESQWEISSDIPKDFIMTSDDFERFKLNYDIDFGFTPLVWFNFKMVTGQYIFGAYLSKYFNLKEEATKARNEHPVGSREYMYWSARREIAKLMMNALYGKFGQNDIRPYQWIEFNEHDAIVTRKSNIDDGEYFLPFSYHYLPIAIFITSYSRLQLFDTKYKFDANDISVYYMDTDSIYFDASSFSYDKEEMKAQMGQMNITIDKKKIGAWDIEHYHEKDFQMLREKSYQIGDFNGEYTTKCGGMPMNIKKQVLPKDFNYGSEFEGKLMPKSVKGGTLLACTTFKIRKASKACW